MKILILQVGKTKDKAYLAIEEEFLKRLRPFCDLETITIKTSDQDTENIELQKRIPKKHIIVALDLRGDQMPSRKFAGWLQNERDHESGKVCFLIGGPHGFTDETLQKVDQILSLSQMTFTHQMVRLFLLEQIYRAFTIINNKTYHY